MPLILAVPVHDKAVPEVAKLRDRLREKLPQLDWVDGDQFLIHLGEVDEGVVDRHGEHVRIAMDKAANAHQGFTVTYRGTVAERAHAGGYVAVARAAEKAGMLQAVAGSFSDRSPEAVELTTSDPWRAHLILARYGGKPSDEARLQLEAAGHGFELRCAAKNLVLVRPDAPGEPLHTATFPSSGG